MGRDKIPVDRAPAGTVCALEFDGDLISCTLCSEPVEEPITYVKHCTEPLVHVSVQPNGGIDKLETLRKALKQLSMLDPNVRVIEQENGELAMLTAGILRLFSKKLQNKI